MYCKACGEPIPAGGRFCIQCGTSVESSVPETTAPPKETPPQVYPRPNNTQPYGQQPQQPYPYGWQGNAPQQAAYGQQPYVQQQPYGQYPGSPPPANKKRGKGWLIGVIAGVLVLALTAGILLATGVLGGKGSSEGIYNDHKPVFAAGNFAQLDNALFYADPGTGALAVSNLDGGNPRILVDEPCFFISVTNQYVYYVDGAGTLCRISPDGSGRTALSDQGETQWATIHDGELYALYRAQGGTDYDLICLGPDGAGKDVLAAEVDPTCINFADDKIYYHDFNDDCIHEIGTDGSANRVVYEDPEMELDHFVVLQGKIYYVSFFNSEVRVIDVASGAVETLMPCSYRATVNVYDGSLYILDCWPTGSVVAPLYRYDPAAGGAPQKVADIDFDGVTTGWVNDSVFVVGDYLYLGSRTGYRFNFTTGKAEQFTAS